MLFRSPALFALALALTAVVRPAAAGCLPEGIPMPDLCRADAAETKRCNGPKLPKATGYRCEKARLACLPPAAKSPKPFTFASHNPPAKTVRGVSLPRTDFTIYRGTELSSRQFSPGRIVRAAFGDPTPTMGSLIHWILTNELAGVKSDRATIDAFYLGDELDAIRKCKAKFSWAEASTYAAALLDDFYWKGHTQKWFEPGYLNYAAKEFETYGDWGKVHIYNGLHPRSSNRYGNHVLVFRDSQRRGMDLNFWNYSHNDGLWSPHTGDVAEYLMPGYYLPSDIVGLWTNNGPERGWEDASYRKIRVGYYVVRGPDGSKAVLVFDGRSEVECVLPGRDGLLYPCEDRFQFHSSWVAYAFKNPAQTVFPKPRIVPNSRPVPLIGAILACPVGTKCALPAWLAAAKAPRSSLVLDRASLDEITGLVFTDGKTVLQGRWFDLKGERSGGIALKRARFLGPSGASADATAYVGNFCNGKRACDYKVAETYLPFPSGFTATGFEAVWSCKGVESRAKIDALGVIKLACDSERAVDASPLLPTAAATGKWTPIAGPNVGKLAVNDAGTVYGLGTDGGVYVVGAGGWQRVSQPAVTDYSVRGDGSIYGVGTDRNLYYQAPGTPNWGQASEGVALELVVPTPTGDVWAIGRDEAIYFLKSGTRAFTLKRSGKFRQVVVSRAGAVYAVASGGAISKRDAAGKWVALGASAAGQVEVGRDGRVYALATAASGAVSVWEPAKKAWKTVTPPEVQGFALGAGVIYGLGTDFGVYSYPLAGAK